MRNVRLETTVDLRGPRSSGDSISRNTSRADQSIENAVRFTPSGSAVELCVEREGESLVFTVADRGPGVAASDRGLIFDRSFGQRARAPMLGAPDSASPSRGPWPTLRAEAWLRPARRRRSVFTLRLPAAEIGHIPADAYEAL